MNNGFRDKVKNSRKILLISYHFPPSTAVGGQRITSFATNLPKLGWQISVLTLKDDYIDKIFMKTSDLDRMAEVRDLRVVRTIKLPTPLTLYSSVKSWLRDRLIRAKSSPTGKVNDIKCPADGGLGGNRSKSLMTKIKEALSLFFEFPDKECRWIIPAVLRACWIVKKEKIPLIMTSSPPHSVQLIGLITSRLTGASWIADFRDPWTTATVSYSPPPFKFISRIEAALEKSVVSNADMVLTTTQRLRDAFSAAYSEEPEDKFIWISNGFDGDILQKVKHQKKYEIFTVTYTGALYIGRSPEALFKAVRLLVDEGKISVDDIAIKLVGHCQTVGNTPTDQLARSYGLASQVEVKSPVPYLEALEMIKRSHIALLLAPGQPYQIPSKVYDYIGLGTPILALTEEGATADIIRMTKTGEIFEGAEIQGIAEYILRTMNQETLSEIEPNLQIFDRFERKTAARNLSNCLRQLITT